MVIYQKQQVLPRDENKNILNDATLEKVALIYQPLIKEIKNRCLNHARGRMHSLYLTGSVARGKAVPYQSDINFYAVLKQNDFGEGLEWVEGVEQALKEKYSFVSDVELKFYLWDWVFPKEATIFSDIAFSIKTQSICIVGDDLAAKIPDFKLLPAIANHFILSAQSDIEEAIVDLKLDQSQANLLFWCHKTVKSMLRAGYALVMHQENGFAWEIITCKEIFKKHYPEQANNIQIGFDFLNTPPPSTLEFLHYLKSFGGGMVQAFNTWFDEYNPERLPSMPLS